MVENIPAFVVPQLILSPPAMTLRLKGVLVRMIKVPDMRPASAPIPSQPRTAVKLISPIVLVSAKRPMLTTAATGLLSQLRMAVKLISPIVLVSAKQPMPITAEIEQQLAVLMDVLRNGVIVPQNAKNVK